MANTGQRGGVVVDGGARAYCSSTRYGVNRSVLNLGGGTKGRAYFRSFTTASPGAGDTRDVRFRSAVRIIILFARPYIFIVPGGRIGRMLSIPAFPRQRGGFVFFL